MLEETIMANLLYNEEYAKKVLPYIKKDYFDNDDIKNIFDSYFHYVDDYKEPPSEEALKIILDKRTDLNEDQYKQIVSKISELKLDKKTNEDWLLSETEKFCQDKDLYNAIRKSILILDGKEPQYDKGALPKLLQDSLSISFDNHIGHDYFEDLEERYDFYHKQEEKIPFDIDILNKITRGGLPRKSLTVLLATCVHPDTKVKIRKTSSLETEWEYEEIAIGDVKELLNDYDIQVDSPDGWVEVTDFIEKEERPEHILNVETGETIRCSDTHLFQTNFGWMFAEDIANRDDISVLHRNGEYEKANCIVTDKLIPIVDITVDHENHRYFTNNISSHNTGGGKSLLKGHFAASCLMHGKNVLYVTAEMSEKEINKRIDANIMDMTMSEVPLMPKDIFVKKVSRFKTKTTGKLITKEYPTGSAHAGNIRHLLNELRLKKDFVPDIIFVDYLNIFASSRLRGSDKSNTYSLIKSVAEELRGLAVEFDVPIVTSSQYNRQGYNNSDVDLTNTSECIFKDELVKKSDGNEVKISDLNPGDVIESNDGTKVVSMVHHIQKKDCVKLRLKSGKTIIVSKDHIFPSETKEGIQRVSINTGLKVGDKLKSK